MNCKIFIHHCLRGFLSGYLSYLFHCFYFILRINFALCQCWGKYLSWKWCMSCRSLSIFLNQLNITHIEKTIRILGNIVDFRSISCLYLYLLTDFWSIVHIFAFFNFFFWILINFFNIGLFSLSNFVQDFFLKINRLILVSS